MTGNRARNQHGLIIQPRDLEVLRELGVMRVADREQVKHVARFGSTTRVNTRLLALTRAGLLRRFFLGSGGGRKALYSLSPKGAQLVRVPCRGPRRPQDATLAADFFVEHQLTVNAVYSDLKFGAIPVPDVRFVQWVALYAPLAPGVNLIPDGYAEFVTLSGIEAMFIEVDLGHESLRVWREKATQYLHFAMSGEYARHFKGFRFRVLVFVNSERRMHSLRAAVAGVTQKIFWFATLDEARGEKFYAPVWLRPTGGTPQPLFDQPR